MYPDVTFAFFDLVPFGENSSKGGPYYSETPATWFSSFGSTDKNNIIACRDNAYRKLLEHNPISSTTTTMTRELYFSVGGINPKFSRMPAEDADLTRRMSINGIAACSIDVSARQRLHAGNMSHVAVENLLGRVKILRGHIGFNITPIKDINITKETIYCLTLRKRKLSSSKFSLNSGHAITYQNTKIQQPDSSDVQNIAQSVMP